MERKHILVVDDEPSARLLISRVLEKAGHAVAMAATGEDAVALLDTSAIDLLIVDKNLPRMTGFDVIDKFRTRLPNIPVVMITAVPEAQAVNRHKIDVYLPKPFKSLKALDEAVKEAFTIKQDALAREKLQQQLKDLQSQLSQKTAKLP